MLPIIPHPSSRPTIQTLFLIPVTGFRDSSQGGLSMVKLNALADRSCTLYSTELLHFGSKIVLLGMTLTPDSDSESLLLQLLANRSQI